MNACLACGRSDGTHSYGCSVQRAVDNEQHRRACDLARRQAAIARAAEAFVAALDVDGEEPAVLRELIAACRNERPVV